MASESKRYRVLLLANSFATLATFMVTNVLAADAQSQRISDLIKNLNADTFAEREASQQQLIKIGEPALDQLRVVAKNGPPETQFRAKAIVQRWEQQFLVRGFTQLGKSKTDAEFDVEQGMFLIARLIDSEVEKEALIRQLDDLATKVKSDLGDDVVLKDLPPEEAVAAIRKVLFTDLGFTGNEKDYDNPVNSSLDVVLETRQGLPILVSHVVVSVADRLEIPIVGIGISGRYMCKYHGANAPSGPQPDIIIDAFGGGQIVTIAELKERDRFFDPLEDLQPHPNRDTIDRMMTNLASDLVAKGKELQAIRVRSLQTLISP